MDNEQKTNSSSGNGWGTLGKLGVGIFAGVLIGNKEARSKVAAGLSSVGKTISSATTKIVAGVKKRKEGGE